jgi:hypothetical protein
MGCEEHVVRQSGYAPSTPFGTSNVPAQQRSLTASQQRSHQPQLSTDWRGTPRMSGQQSTVGQPIVPSGSAATPRTKK